jgi:hypothetical protein
MIDEIKAATPAVTPATPAPAPVVESQPATVTPATPASLPENTVTLDKATHDQLVRDAARAATAQSKADRYEGVLKKNGLLGGGHFKPSAPAAAPSVEEQNAQASEEDRKAERGLMALALDPEYREVIDKDPTLRDLLIKNPLAVLPILAAEALDAEDAISLVKDALGKRKVSAAAPANLPLTPATPPPTPPTGGINPSDKPVNEGVEAARKMPNTENAIAGMIGARLKSGTK